MTQRPAPRLAPCGCSWWTTPPPAAPIWRRSWRMPPGSDIVGQACDGEEGLREATRLRPDVICPGPADAPRRRVHVPAPPHAASPHAGGGGLVAGPPQRRVPGPGAGRARFRGQARGDGGVPGGVPRGDPAEVRHRAGAAPREPGGPAAHAGGCGRPRDIAAPGGRHRRLDRRPPGAPPAPGGDSRRASAGDRWWRSTCRSGSRRLRRPAGPRHRLHGDRGRGRRPGGGRAGPGGPGRPAHGAGAGSRQRRPATRMPAERGLATTRYAPSIDRLFASAAGACGRRVCARGADAAWETTGATGVRPVKAAGGPHPGRVGGDGGGLRDAQAAVETGARGRGAGARCGRRTGWSASRGRAEHLMRASCTALVVDDSAAMRKQLSCALQRVLRHGAPIEAGDGADAWRKLRPGATTSSSPTSTCRSWTGSSWSPGPGRRPAPAGPHRGDHHRGGRGRPRPRHGAGGERLPGEAGPGAAGGRRGADAAAAGLSGGEGAAGLHREVLECGSAVRQAKPGT